MLKRTQKNRPPVLLVSRDKSQWKQAIKGYEDRGYSPGEAFGLALRDQAQEMGMDFLGGALSGAAMSGGNVAINRALSGVKAGQVTNAMLEDILASPEAMNELGVELSEDMTRAQRTEAVKDRLRQIAAAEQTAGKEKTAPTEGTEQNVKYSSSEISAIRREGKTFRNIVAGIDSSVTDFFKKWRNGRRSQDGEKLEKLYLGKMSADIADQVSAIVGYNVEARDFIVTNDDVKHIFDEHGDPEAEVERGNLPLDTWVFDSLQDVVTAPDSIEKGKIGKGKKNNGKQGVVFTKTFSNGEVVCAQFDNKGRGTMEVTTIYVKKGSTTSEMNADTAPIRTSETPEPVLPKDIIRSPGDGVNTEYDQPQAGDGDVHYSLKDTAKSYEGKDLSKDGSVYGYEFLTSLPDMTVTSLPEVGTIQGKDGRINARTVVNLGMENARKVGVEKDGKVFVRNSYTKKQLQITGESIRHGISGKLNRLLTNARLGTVIGELAQNAVPINALLNKAEDVTGTYAMAGYATDSKGREFVGILTVEQRTGRVVDLEVYDMLHAVSGRQKNSSQASTKLQGLNPIKAAKISITDLLETVKSTHQSILSEDVLNHLGEKRNPKGDYTGKALFSIKDAEATTGETSSITGEAEMSGPLTQADAKHFATETGTENGLVLDDYVQKHLRPEKAKQLNTLAQALGVRVRFVNSIRGGTANASIRGSDVQIERYNPNPVTFLLGHELTHRMQSLSPEAYTRFKEAIRPEVEKEAQALHSLYRIRGENIDFEGAIDEATANYAGRLLEKGPVLDEFIQRHKTDRSLLEKVLDAVRDILSKLTGAERKQAETAEAKLLAAMEETAERVKEKAPGKNELTLSAGTDTLKNDLEVLEKRIKPTMTAQVEALPEEQKQALQDYTGFAATRINSAIRYGRITPEIQKKIDLLDTALKDGVMPETVVLHRDTSFAFIAQEIGLSGKPTAEELMRIVGWPVTNRIFTSTSFENLGLLGRDTEIWLTVPAGYRGCQFIQSVARPQFKDQIEVLFARGLRYKITDAKIENGKYILFAEVLQ